MKRFISLKAIAIIAATSMAFSAPASAHDDDDDHDASPGEEVVIGIIGEVIGNAVERKQEKEFERQCRRWYERCEDGNDYACERYENRCD